MSQITKEQVKHISGLAKLELSEAELEKFTKEFDSILNYVSMINDCDVSGIEYEHNLKNFVGKKLYKDIAVKSPIDRSAMLKNATDGRSKNGYVRVSKMVEKE
jgi:aspartyl-tRNA(Asn)/glutamyl-tRNA(Gln) amidotransferase subunit C